jgi:flagellar motor protein MotB
VRAVVFLLGRHANANAFSDYYYEEIEKYIKNTVYGGYIGVIIGDGNPKVIERFDYFTTNASNDKTLNESINDNTKIVLDYLRDENIRAEKPENDLLKAVDEAGKLLSFFEDKARQERKKIINKQIVIIDTGIVTTGDMNFLSLGIDGVLFGILSKEQLDDYTTGIVEILNKNRLLPELKGIDIVFIGMGDVAMPQEELSNTVKHGIENIWKAIFEKCNADSIDIKNYPKGNKVNKFTGDASGFPYVTPIKFEQTIIEGIFTIYTDQVSFIANRADYLNYINAELLLSRYAEALIRYINRKPDVIVYVVGSIARTNLERDYSIELSERRAITVKETLIKYGVPEGKLVVFGLGEFFPNRDDEFRNGMFVEEIARNNRKVVLIPSDFKDEVREVLSVRAELNRRR